MTFPGAGPFTTAPGRCFRVIRHPNMGKLGQHTHCPEPVVCRGTFVDAAGGHHVVDACERHARELLAVETLFDG